jgi:hypothetical protein
MKQRDMALCVHVCIENTVEVDLQPTWLELLTQMPDFLKKWDAELF